MLGPAAWEAYSLEPSPNPLTGFKQQRYRIGVPRDREITGERGGGKGRKLGEKGGGGDTPRQQVLDPSSSSSSSYVCPESAVTNEH